MKFRALSLALFIAACGTRGSGVPFYRSAAMTPEWLSPAEANAASTHRIDEFEVVDQSGVALTNAALGGRITVAHFFFTRCGDVCPITVRNVQHLLDSLPRNQVVQVLSYSVTPSADSVATLRAYAMQHQIADRRWHLVTGDPARLHDLAVNSYFVRLGADSTYGGASIAHTESLVLVDGQRRIRGVYAGTLQLEMDRLREDIRTLTTEHAER